MYRLSQWAGDFPMLWEPHGSFTPLFTSQPEELAFSKSVSLRLHISASCPVFLFSVLFFFLSFPFFCLSSELQHRQCRLVAPPFPAGPLAAMLRRTHRQDLSLCWWIKLFYPIMIDHVRTQSDILRSKSGADEKSPPDNTCWFLQLPTLSVAPCFSFTQLGWVPCGLIDNVINIFFSSSLFLDKHFELYIGKYCIRLQYSCS